MGISRGLAALAFAAIAPSAAMADPCAVQIHVRRLPPHVVVARGADRLRGNLSLRNGDEIRVGRFGDLRLAYAGNRYRIRRANVRLRCQSLVVQAGHPRARVLAIALRAGIVDVRSGSASPRRALVLTPEAMSVAVAPATRFEVIRYARARTTHAATYDLPIAVAAAARPSLRLTARATYTALADAAGLRLDVWPFSLSAAQRAPTPADGLVPFWDDGLACSVGCLPADVAPGWPVKPFREQHAIRSALNELRPANFHVGLDIEARDGQAVYPISSGPVRVFDPGGPDERVQVGSFTYWHIEHRVSPGQFARAYQTVLGTVKYGFKHLAFSEVDEAGRFLNPLRIGGRVLAPWSDTEPPVIAAPAVSGDGRATVDAFDPQSFVEPASYETPVLAPAALAWRLFDAGGHPIGALHWALRGSQHYPTAFKPAIFAPGARNPGFSCFFLRVLCIPTWRYWLAGGLTEGLPLQSLAPGRYRLAVYAWDWAGNASALDEWLSLPLHGG